MFNNDTTQQQDVKSAPAQGNSLCCSANRNEDGQTSNVLTCLCKCNIDLNCNPLFNSSTLKDMLLTFQDRLRIPWPGGARRLPVAIVVPAFVVPLIVALSAVNAYTACIMMIFTVALMYCIMNLVQKSNSSTNALLLINCWSVFYMLLFFEYTVPLLELLPEEDVLLIILCAAAGFCLHVTRRNAPVSQLMHGNERDELPRIMEVTLDEEEEDSNEDSYTALLLDNEEPEHTKHCQQRFCETCRRGMTERTVHCVPCNLCVTHRVHHSYWLNCCITAANHRWYIAGLVLAEVAFQFGINLTLTAVCHPFLFIRIFSVAIMMPDDCTEVFDDYEISIAFMTACFGMLFAVYIFVVIVKQFWLISRGEFGRQTKCGNRKSVWTNWKMFLVGR